jgi:hypothetical protein
MKRVFCLLVLLAASYEPAFAQTPSINELRQMFDYDQQAAPDVREVSVINRNGVSIHCRFPIADCRFECAPPRQLRRSTSPPGNGRR